MDFLRSHQNSNIRITEPKPIISLIGVSAPVFHWVGISFLNFNGSFGNLIFEFWIWNKFVVIYRASLDRKSKIKE